MKKSNDFHEIFIEHINTSQKLGVAIRRLRKQKGLSQMELSKQARLRQATISEIEKGKGTLDSFFRIIRALRVNLVITNKEQAKTRNPLSPKTKVEETIDILMELQKVEVKK